MEQCIIEFGIDEDGDNVDVIDVTMIWGKKTTHLKWTRKTDTSSAQMQWTTSNKGLSTLDQNESR